MKNLLITVGIFGLILFVSCAKTVEGESNSWKRNTQKVSELKSLYPGLKKPLQMKMDEAQGMWNLAEGISDEDEKIEKMASANRIINSGFIKDLKDYDGRKKRLQELIVDVQSADLDANDRNAGMAAKDQAQDAMRDAERRLSSGAKSVSAANSLLKQILSDFNAANKNLKKVLASAESKQKKAQEADKKAAADKAAKEKAKTWKCEYCGKVNDTHAHECKGCGAGKPAS